MKSLSAHLVTTLLFAPLVWAQSPDTSDDFTMEAFLEVPILHAPTISPDGKRVAYLRIARSLEDNDRASDLWMAQRDGGKPKQMTFDTKVRSIAWRADGALTYLASRDGTPQIWVNPLDGSEPRAVTQVDGGIGAYWWSADGHHLAYFAEGAEAEQEGKEEAEPYADWTVYDRLEHPDEYPQLWVGQLDESGNLEAQPRQLTHPPLYAHHAAWSPRGDRIALTYHPLFSGLVDEDHRVALIDVTSGERTDLSPPDRHASLAAFSPDGAQLAFYMDRDQELRAYVNLKDLVVVNLASKSQSILTTHLDGMLGGTGSTPSLAPVWASNGRAIYLTMAQNTTFDLYRLDLNTKNLTNVTELSGNLIRFDISGRWMVYTESALHRPGALWSKDLNQDSVALKIDSTDDAVMSYRLLPPKKLELPGHNGTTVEGFLFLPPNGKLKDKYPTIIEMHGGPYYRYGNAWSSRYPWHVLAHNGFAVFIANPRGGTGYGQDFLRGVYRNFGTDDYLDLMSAVDALIDRRIADPDRLGMTGYSYGGLMTNTVISMTTRFKAAVSIAGMFNYVSAMGQNNPQLFIDSYRQPWAGDLQILWGHSPASRADQIRTPTLIMHGTEDQAVDPRQSKELFTYLQLNGIPSRLVLYPGEGHGINKPRHMQDYLNRELAWFRHYLLGDADSVGGQPAVPVEVTKR